MGRGPTAQRESETRRKLIEAGLELFGLHGLDATSTRALALRAGVNLAAIPYHFGGKAGLYRAVLEYVAKSKRSEIAPCLDRLQAACAEASTDRAVLRQHLRELIRQLALAMLDSPKARSCAQIMLQEQIAPTAGFGILHEHFLLQVHTALDAVLSRLLPLPPGSLELHLHSVSLMGQIFIFRIGMSSLLTLVGSDRLSDAHVTAIVDVCLKQAEALIAGFVPEHPGSDA